MKALKFSVIAACALALAACSDNDEPATPSPDPAEYAEGVFILNQGSYYSQIEGSLSYIDYAGTSSQNVFQRANGRSLGSTPQGGVVYGSKIYIAVYESNVIEILDRNTFKSLKQISLADAEGQSPRALVGDGGKVYISMFNGYVSRLDTLSLSIDASVKVGPNPEIMAVHDGYLYVPNSDGLNYENGYGNTASKIDLKTFSVVKTFEVGLNPTKFASCGDILFLLCMGNYNDINSTIYIVDIDDNILPVAEATMMAGNENALYYIYAPYWANEFTYKKLDFDTGATTTMINDNGVDSPAAIGVDPFNGNIVITSYSLENGYASYNTDGYAKVYNSDGNLLGRYDAGVGPVAVFFNHH